MEDREPGEPGPVREGDPPAQRESHAARSLSVVHYIDRSHDQAARVLAPSLDRAGTAARAPATVIVVPSTDDAIALNESLSSTGAGGGTLPVPVTSVPRGRRILATGASAISGSPATLAALIAESLIPMSSVQVAVVAWPEESLPDERAAALEALVSELPRGAERVALVSNRTPELAQFLERAMWRARTIDHSARQVVTAGVTVRLVTAGRAERLQALRALLDAVDPGSTVLVAGTDAGEADARHLASVLGGSAGAGSLYMASRGAPTARCDLAILLDDAVSADVVSAAAAVCGTLVAMVRPSGVAALRALGVTVVPFSWSGSSALARQSLDSLRDEVRRAVQSGTHMPWVPAIEPLLGDLDPVEVAASALALLDRERRRGRVAAAAVQPESPAVARPDKRPAGSGPRPGVRRDDERGGERKPRWKEDKDSVKRGRDAGIDRVPRAAREGAEWAARGERLRNSRRGSRGGRDQSR